MGTCLQSLLLFYCFVCWYSVDEEEEADYEVVETHNDPSTLSVGFPRTPQNSFASLSPGQQLDDGFEVISQRAEDPTSLLSFDTAAAAVVVVESDIIDKEEEEGS